MYRFESALYCLQAKKEEWLINMTNVAINAKTGLLGLLGNPVGHSVSPAIHGELARIYEQNYAYLAFQVEKEDLEKVVAGALAMHVQGMNVTVPHKQSVMPYLKEIDEKAELLGAVNTLVNVGDGYKGYNTDMPGLMRAMASDKVSVTNRYAVVIGAGGVANAIMGMLMEEGAKEILILNRSKDRAETLADRFRTAYHKENITVCTYDEDYIAKMNQLGASEKWIALQATSVGMYPNVNDTAIDNLEFYKLIEAGYDMIFNPYETRFMKLIKEQGGRAYNGLKMLLYQGIQAFELWTGVNVSEEDAEKVLAHLKDELGIKE